MDDESELLRQSACLRQLLNHYAQATDLEAWQDRLMDLDGATLRELIALHGTLIAQTWLQQNSGALPAVRPGTVLGCYRATRAGRKALAAAARPHEDDDSADAA